MTTFVSVVMPAYNAAQYLSEAIESVLVQTFENLELLIIDNGSTDNTNEIVSHYSQHDKRVKLFTLEEKGVSLARNKGVQISSGQIVAFIDADDRWLPEKLACHIEHLNQDTNLGVSFGRVEFMSSDGKPLEQFSNSCLRDIKPEQFLCENPTVTVSNLVIRREVFEDVGFFEETMNYCEDMDWLLRVAYSKLWKIEGTDKILIQYRISQNSLSSDLYSMEKGWNLLASRTQEYASELVQKHYSQARATYLRYLARRAFRCRFPSQIGVDFMNRALRSDWKLLLKQPRRTILTILAVYSQKLRLDFDLRSFLKRAY